MVLNQTAEFVSQMTRSALVVSPHFPPSTVAGVHRARHLAKHLPAHGWTATVICVDPRYHVEKLDPDLAALVPREVEVVHTPALPVALTRPLGVAGDIGLRGFFHLRQAVAHFLAHRRPEVVMITGSPYYPMLMADWIGRRWGVPVILDFQDPWVSHEGAKRAPMSKGGLAHRLAVMLEPRAVRAASFITSVSDRQNADMLGRYSWLDERRMVAIPIGGDPDDLLALGGRASAPAAGRNPMIFSSVGTALPRAAPLLSALFRGLARLRADRPALADRIRLRFVGTSNQPNDTGDRRVTPLAEAAGVCDLVTEAPARVPYVDALRILAGTDVVIMIGSDEPHYTASKIYPALMSGRPFLTLFHRASSAHRVLSRAGGGVALSFETSGELEALVPAIADGLERLAKDPGSLGRIDPAAYAPYTAHAVAGRFARVFEEAVAD